MHKNRYISCFWRRVLMPAPAWPPRGAVALRVLFEPQGRVGGLAFLNLGGECGIASAEMHNWHRGSSPSPRQRPRRRNASGFVVFTALQL